jgi:DNA-binding MarR family transcriptional regulator
MTAFLLAQVGAYAAMRFDEQVAILDLTPPEAGLLRAIATEPGRSQQALAEQLGTPATRLVALLDGLEQRGAIERRRNPDDRRLHAIVLTEGGQVLLDELRELAMVHGKELTDSLDDAEREQLHGLLVRIAQARKLTDGVHPGYKSV